MKRLLVTGLVVLLFPFTVPASDFDWLVREFSRESGAKQVHVPFFGLARFVVAVGHPAGTTDMKLAIFERGDLETLQFSSLTDSVAGSSWKPMIRVRSRDTESTNIYSRTEGKRLDLLITTLDGDEATFVQLRLKPEALIKFIDEHDSSRHDRCTKE